MKRTFQAVLNLLLGEDCNNIQAPSGPTMSRARSKVDASLMLMRRRFWAQNVLMYSIQLGFWVNIFSANWQPHWDGDDGVE